MLLSPPWYRNPIVLKRLDFVNELCIDSFQKHQLVRNDADKEELTRLIVIHQIRGLDILAFPDIRACLSIILASSMSQLDFTKHAECQEQALEILILARVIHLLRFENISSFDQV